MAQTQSVAGEARELTDVEYRKVTGQLFELGRQVRQPKGYKFSVAALIEHLQGAVEGRFVLLQSAPTSFDWHDFCKHNFGITLSPEFVIPQQKEGAWTIVIPEGLTLEKAYAACEKKFPSYKYSSNLDQDVAKNDRDSKNGTYAVSFKSNIEADEEWKNVSATELKKRGGKWITLLERIVLELYYYELTGRHLDLANWTLCAGSRDSDGYVPGAYWSGGKFGVGWYDPVFAFSDLRARAVVS